MISGSNVIRMSSKYTLIDEVKWYISWNGLVKAITTTQWQYLSIWKRAGFLLTFKKKDFDRYN